MWFNSIHFKSCLLLACQGPPCEDTEPGRYMWGLGHELCSLVAQHWIQLLPVLAASLPVHLWSKDSGNICLTWWGKYWLFVLNKKSLNILLAYTFSKLSWKERIMSSLPRTKKMKSFECVCVCVNHVDMWSSEAPHYIMHTALSCQVHFGGFLSNKSDKLN